MQESWISGGFVFRDKNMAEQAAKEVDAVEYLRGRLEGARPDVVYQMYQQIIQQELFSTPVGYSYLKELRDYLTITAGYEDNGVEAIPVENAASAASDEPVKASGAQEEKNDSPRENPIERRQKEDPEKEKIQGRMRLLFGVNVFLIIAIVAMFIITLTSNNTTILNYENQIIDKYEDWEQELEQREEELKEREAQLAE